MLNHEKSSVYFRGNILPFEEANLSICNTGFLYGLGVFTGMRINHNPATDKMYIFNPKPHFERLVNAAKLMHYENFLANYTYDKFLQVIKELVTANQIKENTYVRFQIFTDENKLTPKLVGYKDSTCAFLYPVGDYVSQTGMRCMVSSWTRVEDNSIPARAKINGSYVNSALAKTIIVKQGYDEAIFLDKSGHVVEGSAENIFLIKGDTFLTPPPYESILEGITRGTVIELARDLGYKVEERPIDRSELYRVDEIFMTGTAAKIAPVVEVDSYLIGNGKPGKITTKIQELYSQISIGNVDNYLHWIEEV